MDMKAGQVVFTPAVRHLPENLTDGDMDVILVELKTPRRKPAATKPASAPTNSNKQ
jgi:hypothetical protein